MGPTVIFDKSFLQSLSVDESVWFDHFFVPIITPLFFVETLSDLEKENIRPGRTPEEEVRIIAEKTPEMNSVPHLHHATICRNELLGGRVPLQGRPIIPGGEYTEADGKKGIVVEVSPEEEALQRWRREEFRSVERMFASNWRNGLTSRDSGAEEAFLAGYANDALKCTTRDQLRALAKSVVRNGGAPPVKTLLFACKILGLQDYSLKIIERFVRSGVSSIEAFAPYTAHVLEIEVFVRFAMQRGFISDKRSSNWVDVAYLHYLPFCHVFVSSDRLHRDCAPLFVRDYQRFAWGPELKADLKRIDQKYKALPREIRTQCILDFAPHPPTDGDFLTAQLWDVALKPSWRNPQRSEIPKALEKLVLDTMRQMKENARLGIRPESKFDPDDADAIVVEKKVRPRKGSWVQFPS